MEKNKNEEKEQFYRGFVIGNQVMRKERLKWSYQGTRNHPLKGRLLGTFLKEKFERSKH